MHLEDLAKPTDLVSPPVNLIMKGKIKHILNIKGNSAILLLCFQILNNNTGKRRDNSNMRNVELYIHPSTNQIFCSLPQVVKEGIQPFSNTNFC